METSNQLLLDTFIRHQIYLIKYSDGMVDSAARSLALTQKKLSRVLLYYATRLATVKLSTKAGRELLAEFETEVKSIRGGAWGRIAKNVTAEISDLAVDEAAFIASAIESSLPVELVLARPKAGELREAATKTPFEGRTLSEWFRGLEEADIARILGAAKIGLVQGDTPEQLVRRVVGTKSQKYKDGVVRKALTQTASLALTATSSTHRVAQTELALSNAYTVRKEYFVATLDSKTTLECMANDGKIFAVGKGSQPPLHFRCRSVRIPYLNADDLSSRPYNPTTTKMLLREYAEKNGLAKASTRDRLPRGHKTAFDTYARSRRRSLIGSVPNKTTYSEWLARQSTEFQDEVLGPARAALFRNGELPLSKFINRAGDTLTLEQLRKKGISL